MDHGAMQIDSCPARATSRRVLVTGTSSGLGAYLQRYFEATGLHGASWRESLAALQAQRFDVIVHCAADTRREPPVEALYAYHESNFQYTDAMLSIPHSLFVYLSSVDVYSNRDRVNDETTPIQITADTSVYALFKLMGEALVKRKASAHLILRPTSIVGPYSRNNNIMKVLTSNTADLTVEAESIYNLVGHRQIADFISLAVESNITGTFNLGGTRSAQIGEIANNLDCRAHFGNHLYTVPSVCTNKVRAVAPFFDMDTIAVAKAVKRQITAFLQRNQATE